MGHQHNEQKVELSPANRKCGYSTYEDGNGFYVLIPDEIVLLSPFVVYSFLLGIQQRMHREFMSTIDSQSSGCWVNLF